VGDSLHLSQPHDACFPAELLAF